MARPENLVAARAMRHLGARRRQPGDLGAVEMDAVREPGPLMQPAALLQIVERAATIHGPAKLGFVAGLGEVSMQAYTARLGQFRGSAHQRCRHAKRRARCQGDLCHRVGIGLVIAIDQPSAVGKDRVLILNHAVGRQSAVALREVHRPAGQHDAYTETLSGGDLDVDRLLQSGGKHIVMIGRRRATR